MKRFLALLLAAVMLLSLAACEKTSPEIPATTEPTTEAPADDTEHFDLNEIDLDGIGELFVQRGQEGSCKIQLDGLCTPVVMELEGTVIVSISAYGTTAQVDPAGAEFAGIYGNLWPEIYEHNGLIFLNIWHDDIGYTCVMCPDGTYMETYPDEEFSVMIYVDEEGQMVQYQFARKFLGIEQWDTGPIDTAISRDDFYYSIDETSWSEDEYAVTAGESYTISDCFDLDEIFHNAKADGLYPDFETLDELLAYNASGKNGDTSSGPDSTREEVSYFDELQAAYDYDAQHNLLTETFYTLYDEVYFVKSHTYNDRNLETAGTWSFRGEEAYRYTNAYDEQDRLTETVWYQGDREVERFTYTYDKKGGHTETFSQNGEKKYTYTFNESGELTAHTVYQGGKSVKTQDVKSLVKTQLLTDIWFPIIDNIPLHFPHYYDGTMPAEDSSMWEITTADDGSRTLFQGSVSEDDGVYYEAERHYNPQGQLLQVIFREEDTETTRVEYQYDKNGCTQEIWYENGNKAATGTYQYNKAGQLIRVDKDYVNPESYYTDAMDIVTYTTRSETYRYNAQGLLVETVVYMGDKEFDRITYDYDANGYILPSMDTYEYVYNAEGVLKEIWLIYEDHAAGAVQLRSRTVYVTAENARQLQEIMNNELSWF